MLDTFIEKDVTNGKDLEMIEKFSEMYQNLFMTVKLLIGWHVVE